jgi:hypothetical protein
MINDSRQIASSVRSFGCTQLCHTYPAAVAVLLLIVDMKFTAKIARAAMSGSLRAFAANYKILLKVRREEAGESYGTACAVPAEWRSLLR